jgi:hypothetical protein
VGRDLLGEAAHHHHDAALSVCPESYA